MSISMSREYGGDGITGREESSSNELKLRIGRIYLSFHLQVVSAGTASQALHSCPSRALKCFHEDRHKASYLPVSQRC
jgi:hypothetical protein